MRAMLAQTAATVRALGGVPLLIKRPTSLPFCDVCVSSEISVLCVSGVFTSFVPFGKNLCRAAAAPMIITAKTSTNTVTLSIQ